MRQVLACFAALVVAPLALAQDPIGSGDVVTLKNGDRLTGTVKSVTADRIVVETAAAGDVELVTGEVVDLQTRGPIAIATEDGERIEAPIQGFSDGNVRIGSGSAVRSLSLSRLVEHRPPVAWSGSINFGGSLSIGNTERRTASAAAEAIRRSDDTRLTLRGTWDYGEDKKDTDLNGSADTWVLSQRRTYGSGKFDYFVHDPLYVYAQVSAENDAFSGLELRATYGLGLGYQFIERADLTLAGEAGVSYVDENRYPPGEDNEYAAARLAYDLRWDVNESLQILQLAEAFPSLEEKDDFYGRLDTRLRSSLTESMYGQLQWILDYDNTPTVGNDRMDHRFILSVGWSF